MRKREKEGEGESELVAPRRHSTNNYVNIVNTIDKRYMHVLNA